MASKTSAWVELQKKMAPPRVTLKLVRIEGGVQIPVDTFDIKTDNLSEMVEAAVVQDASERNGALIYRVFSFASDNSECSSHDIKSRGGSSPREAEPALINSALAQMVTNAWDQIGEHYKTLFQQQQLTTAALQAENKHLVDTIVEIAKNGGGEEASPNVRLAADGINKFLAQGLPALMLSMQSGKRTAPELNNSVIAHVDSPLAPLRKFCAELSDAQVRAIIRTAMAEGFVQLVIPSLDSETARKAVEVAQQISPYIDEVDSAEEIKENAS